MRVTAGDAHAHVVMLISEGWSQRKIAEASGVAVGRVNAIARWPEIVLDARTEQKILSVS